jgi:hypothetical protein
MKCPLFAIAFLFTLFDIGAVQAATITYNTRDIDAGVNNMDYRSSWESQTSAVTTGSLTSFENIWGGNNTFSHLAISFSSGISQLSFQLGVDAGYGGALYLDNVLVASETKDLWWNNNWENTSQMLFSYSNSLTAGNHILEAFWAEGCCNGANSGRFSIGGENNWQSLSADSLQSIAPVPLPAAAWLFGTAIAGYLGVSRRSKHMMG